MAGAYCKSVLEVLEKLQRLGKKDVSYPTTILYKWPYISSAVDETIMSLLNLRIWTVDTGGFTATI